MIGGVWRCGKEEGYKQKGGKDTGHTGKPIEHTCGEKMTHLIPIERIAITYCCIRVISIFRTT